MDIHLLAFSLLVLFWCSLLVGSLLIFYSDVLSRHTCLSAAVASFSSISIAEGEIITNLLMFLIIICQDSSGSLAAEKDRERNKKTCIIAN